MRILAFVLVMVASQASADRLELKKEPEPPPRVREIAHRLFEEATKAVADGNLDVAIARYHQLDELAPHPNVTYNLAVAYERKGNLVKAIEQYDKYLKVETTDAKVARHLAALRATPGQVTFKAESKLGVKTLWYLDGDLVARDSETVSLPPGPHRIDMISEVGWESFREDIEPGKSTSRGNRITGSPDHRKDGNLIIDNTAADRWGWFYAIDGSDRDDKLGKGVHHRGRYVIDPGTHTLVAKDNVCEYQGTFTVGRDEIVFLFLDRKGFDHKGVLADMAEGQPGVRQAHDQTQRGEVRRDPEEVDLSSRPMDDSERVVDLACLTYGDEESRARRDQATALLSPELVQASVHVAAAAGDLDALRGHLDRDAGCIDERNISRGWVPLLSLCYSRIPQAHARACLDLLLARGADPNAHVMIGENRFTGADRRHRGGRGRPVRATATSRGTRDGRATARRGRRSEREPGPLQHRTFDRATHGSSSCSRAGSPRRPTSST